MGLEASIKFKLRLQNGPKGVKAAASSINLDPKKAEAPQFNPPPLASRRGGLKRREKEAQR